MLHATDTSRNDLNTGLETLVIFLLHNTNHENKKMCKFRSPKISYLTTSHDF